MTGARSLYPPDTRSGSAGLANPLHGRPGPGGTIFRASTTYPGLVDDYWTNAVFSVTPTIVVGLIFWFAMRAIIRADRAERKAYSEIEAEERARFDKLHADPHE